MEALSLERRVSRNFNLYQMVKIVLKIQYCVSVTFLQIFFMTNIPAYQPGKERQDLIPCQEEEEISFKNPYTMICKPVFFPSFSQRL